LHVPGPCGEWFKDITERAVPLSNPFRLETLLTNEAGTTHTYTCRSRLVLARGVLNQAKLA